VIYSIFSCWDLTELSHAHFLQDASLALDRFHLKEAKIDTQFVLSSKSTTTPRQK
jgi:hypothetical protein